MNETTIEKHLLDLVKKTVINDNASGDRSKSVHATSLTQPCVRRTYYDITRPKQPLAFETAAVFRVGSMIHAGLVLSKDKNEYSMAANVRTMEPIQIKDINVINFFDCVSGTIDDLMTINGEEVIVDKKTFSSVTSKSIKDPTARYYGKYLPTKVNEDYVNQVNIYKLLYYINNKKDIKKAAIISLDVATRLYNTFVYEIQLDSIENIRQKVLFKLDQLKSGHTPPRVMDWHCNFCQYNTEEVCNPKSDPAYEASVNPPRK